MGALREGLVRDVTVEHRTRAVDGVDVPFVHARPDGMPVAGVVLHTDVHGLRPLFEDIARRLATHGFAVTTFEPFASAPESVRSGGPETRLDYMKNFDDGEQFAISESFANLLVVEDDVAHISALGFCMGGYYVFKAAATERFDAAVTFYGMLRAPEAWRGPGHVVEPLDVAGDVCPTLAFFGTVDPWVPLVDVEALRERWRNRADCEIVVVDGAEHGFVHDPERPIHRADDAAKAWDRTLEWMMPR